MNIMVAAVPASDLEPLPPVVYKALGGGAFLYLVWLISAKIVSRRPWRWGFLAAAAWGVLFPFVQLWFLLARESLGPTLWVEILPASLVTAALVGWASRSPLPPTTVLLGYVFTGIRVDDAWSALILALPVWHIGVATGLLGWAIRERRDLRHGVDRCPSCG